MDASGSNLTIANHLLIALDLKAVSDSASMRLILVTLFEKAADLTIDFTSVSDFGTTGAGGGATLVQSFMS